MTFRTLNANMWMRDTMLSKHATSCTCTHMRTCRAAILVDKLHSKLEGDLRMVLGFDTRSIEGREDEAPEGILRTQERLINKTATLSILARVNLPNTNGNL